MFKQITTLTCLMAFAINAESALVNSDASNLVTNGSFVGAVANSTVAPDWSFGTNNGEPVNSPDIMNASANFGFSGLTDFAAAPSATPDGENWVGLARDGATQNEKISQIVTGFVIGQTYSISWYEANFGYDVADDSVDFTNANAIQASIGNDYQFNAALIGTSSDWLTRSFTFQATQSSYNVSFGLINPARSYLSLDGVSINAVAAVPEPSGYAMLIAGGLLLAGFVRKQHS